MDTSIEQVIATSYRPVSSAMSRRLVAVIGSLPAPMLAALVSCGEIATSARLDIGPTFLLDGSGNNFRLARNSPLDPNQATYLIGFAEYGSRRRLILVEDP
jgi:hypothetical protein